MSERMTAQERAAKLQLGKRTTADAAAAIEAAEAARDAEWRAAFEKARSRDGNACIFLYYPGHSCECANCEPLRALAAQDKEG